MDTADDLIAKLKVIDPDADAAMVKRAYDFAQKVHEPQYRQSGEPYFTHPVAVAGILIEQKLDWQSVVTALLHDTVEDTDATLKQIEDMFTPEIAMLVNGVTKLGKLELSGDGSSSAAENFRKLFLAMSEDIRVLLVKLADRLHNMRTLTFMKPHKQKQKSRETVEIYAPLAERIGMERVKAELQELAFTYLNPDAHDMIARRVNRVTMADGGLKDKIIAELKTLLDEQGIDARITGRIKANYSIWMKMQAKSIDFEQLSDIMAFRILVGDVKDCYAALGQLHAVYAMVPGRFKDYISLPKQNGYRSLHTGIVGPLKRKIEVQIRTEDMHATNEFGLAAHWAYKQGSSEQGAGDQTSVDKPKDESLRFLAELREILEQTENPDEFLEHTKMEMYRDQVFAFTPRGRLISLTAGATPIDFAYEVHTGVGNTCTGAKVNGRIRPLQTVLQNGDQVDIITAKNANPSPDWLNFVVSGKAKAAIRRFKRNSERDQYVELGRKMLDKAFGSEDLVFSDKALVPSLKLLKKLEVEDVLQDVGSGVLSTREVLHAAVPNFKPKQRHIRNAAPDEQFGDKDLITFGAGSKTSGGKSANKKTKRSSTQLPIKGLIPGLAMHYARCCHPLRGDRIVGITTTGKGVTIHTLDCDTLERFQDQPERWLSVSWDNEGSEAGAEALTGRLAVTITNEPGSLAALTAVIDRNDGNINNLRIVNRNQDFFDVLVDVEVLDKADLSVIMGALRSNRHITDVSRARG